MLIWILNIPATADGCAKQMWFESKTALSRFLCGTLYAYTDVEGRVINSDGETIGEWYPARRGRGESE